MFHASIYRDHHNNHTLAYHKLLVSEMKMNTLEPAEITATTPRNEASFKKKYQKYSAFGKRCS